MPFGLLHKNKGDGKMNQDILNTVSAMIAKQLKLDPSEVTADKRLLEDLKADSANIMVLIMDLEDQYDLTVEDAAITELKTVGDIAEYIEKHQ